MPDYTELAEMQFARLTSTEQRALLRRIFYTLEYDSNGAPGVELSSKVMDAIPRLFNAYGVTFTNPDHVPTQFRYNDHRDAQAQQCPYALQPAPPPDAWGAKSEPPWCPNGCLGSIIEGRTPEPEPEPAANGISTNRQASHAAVSPSRNTPAAPVNPDNGDPETAAACETKGAS